MTSAFIFKELRGARALSLICVRSTHPPAGFNIEIDQKRYGTKLYSIRRIEPENGSLIPRRHRERRENKGLK
jgi:hypothetical protein